MASTLILSLSSRSHWACPLQCSLRSSFLLSPTGRSRSGRQNGELRTAHPHRIGCSQEGEPNALVIPATDLLLQHLRGDRGVGGKTGECFDPIALHENAVGGASCVLARSQEGGEGVGAPSLAEFIEFGSLGAPVESRRRTSMPMAHPRLSAASSSPLRLSGPLWVRTPRPRWPPA